MKPLIISLLMPCVCLAQSSHVHSYNKKNGTHVESYHRSHADHTQRNNYSAQGNTNPYTGKKGYKKSKK